MRYSLYILACATLVASIGIFHSPLPSDKVNAEKAEKTFQEMSWFNHTFSLIVLAIIMEKVWRERQGYDSTWHLIFFVFIYYVTQREMKKYHQAIQLEEYGYAIHVLELMAIKNLAFAAISVCALVLEDFLNFF